MPKLIENFPAQVQSAFQPFESKIDQLIDDNSKEDINELVLLSEKILEEDVPIILLDYSRLLVILLLERLFKARPDLKSQAANAWIESLYQKTIHSANEEVMAYAIVSVMKYIANYELEFDEEYKAIGKLQWSRKVSGKLMAAASLSANFKNRCLVSVAQFYIESTLSENSGFSVGINILLNLIKNDEIEKDLSAYAHYYLAKAVFAFHNNGAAAAVLFKHAFDSGELEPDEQANCLVHIAYVEKDEEVREELYKKALAIPGVSKPKRAKICLDMAKLFCLTLAEEEPSFVKMKKALIYLKCALWFDQSPRLTLDVLEGMACLVGESTYPTYDPKLFEKVAEHFFLFEKKLEDDCDNEVNNARATLIHYLLGEQHEINKHFDLALFHYRQSLKRGEKLNDEKTRNLRWRAHSKISQNLVMTQPNSVKVIDEALENARMALKCCKTKAEKDVSMLALRVYLEKKVWLEKKNDNAIKSKDKMPKVQPRAEVCIDQLDIQVALNEFVRKACLEINTVWGVKKADGMMICSFQTVNPKSISIIREWLEKVKEACEIVNIRINQPKFSLSPKSMSTIIFSFAEEDGLIVVEEAKRHLPKVGEVVDLRVKNQAKK